MSRTNEGPGPRLKVVRLSEAYSLGDIGDELANKWTRSDDRVSLRSLADLFNRRLLASALEEAGVNTVSEDVTYLYEVLTETTGTSSDRTQIRSRLEREGVDVNALVEDFVTYQAIRTYLKNYRDVSPPSKDGAKAREADSRTIEQLRNRTAAVAESKLDRLERLGELHLGESHVLVDIQVYCESCDRQYDIGELLETGSCNCDPSE